MHESSSGTKRTSPACRSTSAFGDKADIDSYLQNVRFRWITSFKRATPLHLLAVWKMISTVAASSIDHSTEKIARSLTDRRFEELSRGGILYDLSVFDETHPVSKLSSEPHLMSDHQDCESTFMG